MAYILVIDDEEAIGQTIEAMLEDSGHRCQIASSGIEAEAIADLEHFDIAIVDMLMPEKDGIETIFAFRRRFPNMKIIAISGGGRFQNFGYLRFAREFGAAVTMQKPFIRNDLLMAVICCLGDSAKSEGRSQLH